MPRQVESRSGFNKIVLRMREFDGEARVRRIVLFGSEELRSGFDRFKSRHGIDK